jgi:hypothetical protein
MNNQFKLIICVFACDKKPKYIQELRVINETWGQMCPDQVKVLYFLGEQPTPEFSGPQYINLKGVGEDHTSSGYKQFLGLKYIYENYKTEFVHCCGTDTYINIPKLLKLLSNFDPEESLYIGGHGCHRKIGEKTYYFHSGGPGFVISRKCLQYIYPILADIMTNWINTTIKYGVFNDLHWACDVAIAYYLQQEWFDINIIKQDDLSFLHCNYLGIPCHPGQVDVSKIVACHSMSGKDFNDFTEILKNNSYYI